MWSLPQGLALTVVSDWSALTPGLIWLSSNHSGLCLNVTSFDSSYCSLTLPKLFSIVLSYVIFFKEFFFPKCPDLLILWHFHFQSPLRKETSSICSLLYPSTKSTFQHTMTFNICWLTISWILFPESSPQKAYALTYWISSKSQNAIYFLLILCLWIFCSFYLYVYCSFFSSKM